MSLSRRPSQERGHSEDSSRTPLEPSPSSSTPSPPQKPEPEHHPPNHYPPSTLSNRPHLQNLIEACNPPLRHLASHSTVHSTFSRSGSVSSLRRSNSNPQNHTPNSRNATTPAVNKKVMNRPLSTTFEEQRYSAIGRPSPSITRSTKMWDPEFKEKRGSSMSDTTTLAGGSMQGIGGSRLREGYIAEEYIDLDEANAEVGGDEEEEGKYPGPLGLFILVFGIALCVFLISLDRTIITTAIPYIEAEFDGEDYVGWYGSAYLLTASAFQPLYGRIYTLFNTKWAYLTSLFMFEIGSLICGIAPNSTALIIGRAIAGLGSAGLLTGSFVVTSYAVPLRKRPVLTAVVGLMFGVGATAGPLLGGVFTDLVTWRWCFYFSLPVGGATGLAMLAFFHPQNKHAHMDKSIFYRISELDIMGNFLLLSFAIQLFLALQFSEEDISWSSPRIIGLLCGSGVTSILFCAWQWWKQDGALMPPRILGQRTVAASCAAAFFIYSAILVQTYYLPQWFEAVKDDSAIVAGVHMIPYVVANALFSLLAGIFVSKNGYFVAPAVIGMIIGTGGSAMIYTFDENTPTGYWIGAEILASAGIGMAIQQGFTAVQIVLPLEEVAIGTAAVVAFQSLGGSLFISIGNSILQNTLRGAASSLPGVDIDAVINAGASDFRKDVSAEMLPAVVAVYNEALTKVLISAIPPAGLAIIACLFMEWRKVRDSKKADEENLRRARKQRVELESALLDKHRRTHSDTMTTYSSEYH